ncbi:MULTISPECIES: TolC family outer membrane protein [Tenebrionibacter/Tenebrionicola group]|jgi:protease secretion system outer membrane protein|uniref:TolC family outer membrane protein n=2 Tax=Tenebrionibacter/Tenebrionicola group TaxID=2969848 RepID=A0A8K0V5Y4_9ENTR|nr:MULTISPECIES: TolC family outer membrane protein [Tenebrionibacter/Tenebrionicola group]MBK4716008.1 TolC family outer membrane protein [Tenebrionibacter intestinalis]MBV5096175.1 TolC family outer membrane protein [Tenebrionicola larvae]
MSHRMRGWLLFLAAVAAAPAPAVAQPRVGVKELYAMALEQDPAWLAAQKAWQADSQSKNIARSEMLPQVRLNYQNAPYNKQIREEPQTTASGRARTTTGVRHYDSYNGSIGVTQPVFDYGAWSRYRAAVEQGYMADARLRDKEMELAVRTVNLYLDLSLAIQKRELASHSEAALREQLKVNTRLLATGEGTRTEVLETETRLRIAETETLACQDELDVARRALAAVVGHPLTRLSQLKTEVTDRFTPLPLLPTSYEDWQKLALTNNASVSNARHQVEQSRYNLSAQKAEYLPQVSVYASRALSHSATDTSIDRHYDTTSVGIQVSMSLYAGGRTNAARRQAGAELGRSQYELENTLRSTSNELYKAWKQSAGAAARLRAYSLAVEAAQLQLNATQKGVVAGQRVNLDILNARQQLFSARKDLITEKYNYIRSWLMLHYHAGRLTQEELKKIDRYFS